MEINIVAAKFQARFLSTNIKESGLRQKAGVMA